MLSRTTYTEDQAKQILHQVLPALKKRLQEATEQLRNKVGEVSRLEHELEAKSLLEDENDTLTQQLIRLKAHFQEKIKHLEGILEQERSQKNSNDPSSSVPHDVLHRERLQRQALESSLIHLQDLLTRAQKERQQGELDLNQAKTNGVQLERVIAFLREQVDELQKSNLSLRGEKENLQQELAKQLEKKGNLEQVIHEKNQVELFLHEKEQKLTLCEREIALIKQSLLRGLKEVKELEARYEDALKEKGIALQKFQQSHLHVEKLRGQVQFLQEQVASTTAEQDKAYQELETTHTQLTLAESQLLIAHEKLTELEKGYGDTHGVINSLKTQLFEKEGDLLQAQQHLAKKVKEVAQLEDKNEEYRLFVNELQQVQNQSRVKLAELQTATDFQSNLQKKLEDQQQELSKAHEQHLEKWEEKYFSVYEKWQAAEGRLKELEKMEDKQKQLQGILANLGSVLSPSVDNLLPPPVPPAPVKEVIMPPTPHFAMQIPAKPANTLFERPKTQKLRQTFLE